MVEDVSFTVAAGEILGLVGESGSGKTTTALALLGYTRRGVEVRGGSDRGGRREHRRPRLRPASQRARQGRLVRAAGSRRRAQPVAAGGRRDHGRAARAPLAVGLAGLGAVGPRAGRAGRRPPLRPPLPAPALGRPAAARDDRDGLCLRAAGGGAGRAHHRARRAHPGPHPDRAGAATRRGRHVDGLRLPRPGRGRQDGRPDRGHVRRPGGRERPRRRGDRRGRATPTRGRWWRPSPTSATRGRCRASPACRPASASGRPAAASPRAASTARSAAAPTVPVLSRAAVEHDVRCCRWQELSLGERRAHGARAVATEPAPAPLLEVSALEVRYRSARGARPAVEDVSFAVGQGQCVALVGESGSGKTTVGRCIAGLHEPTVGTHRCSTATELAGAARRRSLDQRRRIQIVFQNPFESLNPRHHVASSIERPLRVLRGLSRAEADTEVGELLERVRLPRRLGDRFPIELSGGERQRVAIARALAAKPDLLVCDEVTSALDVSVQAAVLELLAELQRELRLSMLFITHNLGVVACIGDCRAGDGSRPPVRDGTGGAGAQRAQRRLHAAAADGSAAAARCRRRLTRSPPWSAAPWWPATAAPGLTCCCAATAWWRWARSTARAPASWTRPAAWCCPGRSTCTRTCSASIRDDTRSALLGGTTSALAFVDAEPGERPAEAARRTLADEMPQSLIDLAFHAVIWEPQAYRRGDLAAVAELGVGSIKLWLAYLELGIMADDDVAYEVIARGRRAGHGGARPLRERPRDRRAHPTAGGARPAGAGVAAAQPADRARGRVRAPVSGDGRAGRRHRLRRARDRPRAAGRDRGRPPPRRRPPTARSASTTCCSTWPTTAARTVCAT